jgi:methionine aminotransferase
LSIDGTSIFYPALPMSEPEIQTKFPQIGTTIFTVMSALAQAHDAVNLGQGFPDFACDPALLASVTQAMQDGHNQYPPMTGIASLREAVSHKVQTLYHRHYDPVSEITITAGATQAILSCILAIVRPGDEAIVLEPCYDSYLPNIDMAGGTAVRVPLTPGTFRPDFQKIAQAITPRTRVMIINTPHNPSATIWQQDDWLQLQTLLQGTDIWLISDEVYEHMVYAPNQHHSAASFPALAQRAFIISSFGKTFHVTGWKIGYVCAPTALSAELRKVHQFNVFTVNTPMQHGLAAYLKDPTPYLQLPAFYAAKRDLFRQGLAQTKFELLPSEGSYFQCVRIDGLGVAEKNLSEADFCQWLTREIGVAAIPLSAFYADGFDQGIIRFCFAKKDDTLREALRRLGRL